MTPHPEHLSKDIVERLRQVRGDAEDAREAAASIERLRNDYAILKRDYDALREELAALQAASGYEASIAQVVIEHLRTTLGYLADNMDNPALVAVAETALKPKP